MEWTNEQSERERINESEQEWGEICVQTFERVKWATVVYCVIFFFIVCGRLDGNSNWVSTYVQLAKGEGHDRKFTTTLLKEESIVKWDYLLKL